MKIITNTKTPAGYQSLFLFSLLTFLTAASSYAQVEDYNPDAVGAGKTAVSTRPVERGEEENATLTIDKVPNAPESINSGDSFDDPPKETPIDGGLVCLLAAGAAYGVKKQVHKRGAKSN